MPSRTPRSDQTTHVKLHEQGNERLLTLDEFTQFTQGKSQEELAALDFSYLTGEDLRNVDVQQSTTTFVPEEKDEGKTPKASTQRKTASLP